MEAAAANDVWVRRISRACAYLAGADERVSLAALARRIGGSPYHLHRNFKRIVGVTPREYGDACRLRDVKQRLRAGEPVTDAVTGAGYGSSSRFYERAAAKLGMPPAMYRRGGTGLRVRYSIVDSRLGRLLVAATDKGVCSIEMGEKDQALAALVEEEFPSATVVRDDRGLASWTAAVVAHLDGQRPRVELPLDVQATAFQWQVWKALSAIPRGETRTYAALAKAIGRPKAARAVGHACASNPVAIVIPCHRAVPASGGVGRYRWGSHRKKALLERERTSE